MRKILLCFFLTSTTLLEAQVKRISETDLMPDEQWWGMIARPTMLKNENRWFIPDGNYPSLIVSSTGRYVWSEKPFGAWCEQGKLMLESYFLESELITLQSGRTLREAYQAARTKYLKPQTTLPYKQVFAMPLYFIEAPYNAAKIVEWARWLIVHGFPAGVIVLDESWQDGYGSLEFSAESFPDPAALFKQLHDNGFRVMLSVVPYVGSDYSKFNDEYENQRLTEKNGEPKFYRWEKGWSGCYNVADEQVQKYVTERLDQLRTRYRFDGFRFSNLTESSPEVSAEWSAMSRKFRGSISSSYSVGDTTAMICEFPLHDLSQESVNGVIEQITNASMMLRPLTTVRLATPDSVAVNQHNFLLGIQLQSLLPIMQIPLKHLLDLSDEALSICSKAVQLHSGHAATLTSLFIASARTGEPMIRPVEYDFPNSGMDRAPGQYMLGSRILVAPLGNNAEKHTVQLPKGYWINNESQRLRGAVCFPVHETRMIPYFKIAN